MRVPDQEEVESLWTREGEGGIVYSIISTYDAIIDEHHVRLVWFDL